MDIVCAVSEGEFTSKSVAIYICRASSNFTSTIILNHFVCEIAMFEI